MGTRTANAGTTARLQTQSTFVFMDCFFFEAGPSMQNFPCRYSTGNRPRLKCLALTGVVSAGEKSGKISAEELNQAFHPAPPPGPCKNTTVGDDGGGQDRLAAKSECIGPLKARRLGNDRDAIWTVNSFFDSGAWFSGFFKPNMAIAIINHFKKRAVLEPREIGIGSFEVLDIAIAPTEPGARLQRIGGKNGDRFDLCDFVLVAENIILPVVSPGVSGRNTYRTKSFHTDIYADSFEHLNGTRRERKQVQLFIVFNLFTLTFIP